MYRRIVRLSRAPSFTEHVLPALLCSTFILMFAIIVVRVVDVVDHIAILLIQIACNIVISLTVPVGMA